jgi:hypothetical protein
MYTVAAAAAYQSANRVITSAGASNADLGARSEVEQLKGRIERQNLLIQTMLMILLEKKVLHEDEFKEWLNYVDELDGVRDGKLREDKKPLACSQCGRNSPKGSAKCIYCGTEFETDFLYQRPQE